MNTQSWKKELAQGLCLVAIVSIVGSCVFFDGKHSRDYRIQKMQIELETKRLEKE